MPGPHRHPTSSTRSREPVELVDMPDACHLRDYLTSAGLSTSWTEQEIDDVLQAEAAAQSRTCWTPNSDDGWAPDLAEALRRRVLRSLAARKTPLGFAVVGDLETARVSGRDSEITRLEAPFRRWSIA